MSISKARAFGVAWNNPMKNILTMLRLSVPASTRLSISLPKMKCQRFGSHFPIRIRAKANATHVTAWLHRSFCSVTARLWLLMAFSISKRIALSCMSSHFTMWWKRKACLCFTKPTTCMPMATTSKWRPSAPSTNRCGSTKVWR